MTSRPMAVVTGGAGGIGTAICGHLLADGFEVVSLDRTPSPLDSVRSVLVDLADANRVVEAAATVLGWGRPVGVLVHCAADFSTMTLDQLDLDVWHRVQAVNVESLLLLAHAVVPAMPRDGTARVIVIGSDTMLTPPSGALLPYVASKAALVGIVRTLARGLGEQRISVTAVAPGLTATDAARQGLPAAAWDDVLRRQSLARQLHPDDVARAVAFLAGPGGEALTGQTLVVNGGLATP